MFYKLAWRNSKRSRNENLIYFFTMVIAAAAFYIILSLKEQDVIRFLGEIESDAVQRLLTNLMPTVYFCVLLFVFFLVVFANKYQLECRSRELGLYLMFGMTKKHLFIHIMVEGIITSFLALLGGLLSGTFLSEITSIATARLVGYGIIVHQSSFSISAVIFTILGFLLIQSVALFLLCGKLFRKELYQLLYGEIAKKHWNGNAYISFLSLILGCVFLIVAYWIVLSHFTDGIIILFISVVLGIIGTILFIKGTARLLSVMATTKKHKSTKSLYTFTLRQLQENVVYKYISISVASILMMLTIMLIADGSTRIISNGNELTKESSVYDFTIVGEEQTVQQCLSSKELKPYVENLNRMEIGEISSKLSVDWSILREKVVQSLPSDVLDSATQEATGYSFGPDQPASLNLLGCIDTNTSPHIIPISSYNRLLEAIGEKNINLKNEEMIYYINPDFLGKAQKDTISLLNNIVSDSEANGQGLISIKGKSYSLVPNVTLKGLTADENIKIMSALIVSDEMYSYLVNPNTTTVYWNFCIPDKLVKEKGLILSIMETQDLLKPSGLYYESYLNNFGRQLFYIVSGGYTDLYMGFMLLIIACALLALQFLTQMQSTKSRYLTLSILGANRKQIKQSIKQQVLCYFLLPLSLACVSGAVGLYTMQKHLHSASAQTENAYPLLIVMSIIVILVIVVYGIAVAKTAIHEIGKMEYKTNA